MLDVVCAGHEMLALEREYSIRLAASAAVVEQFRRAAADADASGLDDDVFWVVDQLMRGEQELTFESPQADGDCSAEADEDGPDGVCPASAELPAPNAQGVDPVSGTDSPRPSPPHELGPFCGLGSPTDAASIRARLRRAAHEVARTCVAMYTTTATGLAPEIVTFDPRAPGGDFVPNHDARHSLLRPETVESLFLLHRLSTANGSLDGWKEDAVSVNNDSPHNFTSSDGDRTIYREWGWRIFDAIERHARVAGGSSAASPAGGGGAGGAGGYSSVKDVDLPISSDATNTTSISGGRGNQSDKMESFFLAETMKYLYLLFSPSAVLPLDAWIFNTEAHPVRLLRPASPWPRIV
jgi:mannosyl-oligosaccharide alpha-1,2-mannosidase